MDYNRPPCQDTYADDWFIEEPHRHPAAVERVEAICRTQCPLARQVQCARNALRNKEEYGTWAGVTLAGTSSCKKHDQAARKERLRLIAGLEQCYKDGCRAWFPVAEHNAATLAAARSQTLDLPHKQQLMCPKCQAAQENTHDSATPRSIEATRQADVVGVVDETNPDHDFYWTARELYSALDDRRPDWMLIRPNGIPEGRYAWSVAAHGFGRSLDRLRDMLAGGWVIREATIADRDWHRSRPRALNAARRPMALAHPRHADRIPA